jgi:hypothetical protein
MDLPAFKREMADNETRTLTTCVERLRAVGMSARGLSYVSTIRGYAKTPYYTTVWVQDEPDRRRLGAAVCAHAVGVKLLDDLVDRDSPVEPRDLVLGVTLLQRCTTTLARYPDAAAALAALDLDFQQIWRQVVRDTRVRPTTLDGWLADARVKAGMMLASYTDVCCRAAGQAGSVARARRFGEALGTLYMLGDDWMDFREQGQAAGNLGHLVAIGRVPLESVEQAIDTLRGEGARALSGAPVVCDLEPFLDHFARKLKRLYADVASAPRSAAG